MMVIEGVTRRQADMLLAIVAHIDRTGRSPSYRDLQAATGSRNKSNVHRLVDGFQQRGLIERTSGRGYSIVVTKLGRERIGRPPVQLDAFAALPADVRASLEAHCKRTGENPAAVVADAIKLHLDSFDLVEV
jgi:SOS-response transcriptional repressor LexA